MTSTLVPRLLPKSRLERLRPSARLAPRPKFVPSRREGLATRDAALGERDIVARLRLGEDEAYETLVRTYGPRMLNVARGYLPTEEDAENATQSAFLLAFRGIHRFDGASRLSTWLHRIVVNSALMRLRYNRRHPEVRLDAQRTEAEGTFGRPGHGTAVAEVVGRRDASERVLRAVRELPDATRAATRLHLVYGRTLSETSLLLGRPLGSVKGCVERGRRSLRALLTPAAGWSPET